MARGSLSGFIAGTVVSGAVAGVASVMTDVPGAGAPEATALEVPAGSEFDQSRDDTQAALPATQESPDANEVVKVEPPQPDDLSTIDTDATTSASLPETGDTEVALNAPAAGDSAAGVQVDSDSPVLPAPQANAPQAPASEDELSISTEPAQPALPDVAEEETAFTAPSAPEPAEDEQAVVEEESQDRSAATAEVTEPETPTTEADTQDQTAVAEPEAPTSDTQSETAQAGEDQAAVQVQDDVVEPRLPVIEIPDAAPEAEVTPSAPAEPQDEQVAVLPETNVPTSTIDDIAPNVTTDRLPSVSTAPEAAEDGEAEAVEDVVVLTPVPDGETQPPIQRFAAEFENPDNKPLMSIVLIDKGDSPIGLEALKSFPYPLNFAVDTSWPGAGDAMQKYREAGFEVLALIDLPEGQAATDTEVSMQTYLERVPQAVAVMEGDGSGLQAGREASEQLAQILRDTGHGAVLFPNGLNTAQKLIAREGVPSASVFRDFDAKGQNATVIRRFLDQAAFRAGQEGKGVIMVGRLRADTISALLLWGLQDRAGRVAVAPVSAVLTAE